MPIGVLNMYFHEMIVNDEFIRALDILKEPIDLCSWGGVSLHAVSAKDTCVDILMQLAMEMIAYSRTQHDNPMFEGTLLYRDIKWDWKTFDNSFLENMNEIADDIEGTTPKGYLTLDIQLLNKVYEQYPELRDSEFFRIDDSDIRAIRRRPYPSMVAINLWKSLKDAEEQNKILLASNLSIPIVVTISERIKELIFEISRKPETLRKLDSRRVEELVAGLIEDKGFKVELTAKTRDGGRDVIALKGKGELLAEERYLIEVKHPEPENSVSVGAVRELVGVGQVDPSTGLVLVSSTRFTRDAVELAAREALRYRLSLKDYNDLMSWVNEYCKKRG